MNADQIADELRKARGEAVEAMGLPDEAPRKKGKHLYIGGFMLRDLFALAFAAGGCPNPYEYADGALEQRDR